jgi:hypothetical protein
MNSRVEIASEQKADAAHEAGNQLWAGKEGGEQDG